jgi:hypothetical protein
VSDTNAALKGSPKYPSTFIEEAILFPICVHGNFVKNQLAVDVWIYFRALNSVPLVYVFVFISESCCFDYCSFVVYFEIRQCDAFSFALFAQDCFGYSRSLVLP